MNERKFWDPSQPQTLQAATFLLYFRAVSMLLWLASLDALVIGAGLALGAFGMAKGKRWGYFLATTLAIIGLLVIVLPNGPEFALRYNTISLMLAVALVALLLHPESREYQRVWFR